MPVVIMLEEVVVAKGPSFSRVRVPEGTPRPIRNPVRVDRIAVDAIEPMLEGAAMAMV